MAKPKLGARIEIDGENAYKQAIESLKSENRVLSSEMRLLSEQYKGNEDSLEALQQKSRIYVEELAVQSQKVETVRQALKNARDAMVKIRETKGVDSEEYALAARHVNSWRVSLNDAEREQVKLERALEDTNREIVAQGEAAEEDSGRMTTLGDQISGIAEKFGVRLPSGIKTALDHVDGFSAGTVAAMSGVAAGVGAVKIAIDAVTAGIRAAQELNKITLEQAKWADDLLTRSAQTGLDTSTLQGLDYASKFLDFEGIDQSLVKLTTSMDKARDGAEKQAEAFNRLGVSVTGTDGELRDNWETFKDVIDALGKVENETERDALANELFGKSYSDLKPLIDAGSDALQDFMDEANNLGHVLDESQIRKLGEVDDAYQEYQLKLDDVKRKIAVEFAPVSIGVMKRFGDFVGRVGNKFVDSGIIDSVGKLVAPLGTLLDTVSTLVDIALPPFVSLIDGVAGAFEKGVEWVSEFVGWLSQIDETKIEQAMIDAGDMGYYGGYNPAFNAAGDPDWRGGLTWVGEGGPELLRLPQGSRIYSNQESRQITNAGADMSKVEALLERNVRLLEQISGEFSGLRVRERMA